MNATENGINFTIGLDTSKLQSDAAEATKILTGIDQEAEKQSDSIRELLTNIPAVNINVVDNATNGVEAVGNALKELDRCISENQSAITTLSAAKEKLNHEYSNTFQANQQEADAIRAQIEPIEENIRLREELIQEAVKTKRELESLSVAEEQNTQTEKESTEQKKSLKQEIRELQEEMARYVMENGTDQTAEYQEMAKRLGELRDIRGDIQAQGSVFANDEQKIAGVIQGVQGLAGAFGVAQGAVALFGDENEDLNRIMLKVQSIMSITMGLQQLQQTLNKDSAFQLVVVNGLRNTWNKLMGESAVVTETQTAAEQTNTAATNANATAVEADTAAETANITSKEASTTATTANTAATNSGTAAKSADVTATNSQTTATNAQTVATKGATIATKALRIALLALGITAIIAAVTQLVKWLKDWMSSTDSVSKANEMLGKSIKDAQEQAAQSYSKTSAEIDILKDRVDNFNGSQKEEKRLVDELNQKFGESLGYYYDLATWKQKLADTSMYYQKQLEAEALAQALMNEYAKAYVEIVKGNDVAENNILRERLKEEIRRAQDDAQFYRSMLNIALDLGGGKGQKRPSSNTTARTASTKTTKSSTNAQPKVNTTSTGNQFDWEKAEREQKNAEESYVNAVQSFVDDANKRVSDMELQGLNQGYYQSSRSITADMQEQLKELDKQLEALAKARQEKQKSVYMSKQGATENAWYRSAEGRKSTKDYVDELLNSSEVVDGTEMSVAQWYQAAKDAIMQGAEKQKQDLQKQYYDEMIDQYGGFWDRYLQVERDWGAKILNAENDMRAMRMPYEQQGKIIDVMIAEQTRQLSKMRADNFKDAVDWQSITSNLSNQSTASIKVNMERIRKFLSDNINSLATDEVEGFRAVITQLQGELDKRNPLGGLTSIVNEIKSAKQEYVAASKALRDAENEEKEAHKAHTDAIKEEEAARAALAQAEEQYGNGSTQALAALKEHQKAEANVTKAVKAENDAKEKSIAASNRYVVAANRLNTAYAGLNGKIQAARKVFNELGRSAVGLASIFSEDVAQSISQVIGLTNDIMDATQTTMESLKELGIGVAKGVNSAVDSTQKGVEASAKAGSAAISTMEKASAILAIISAAIQVATTIASMFDKDDKKEKRIKELQNRIDTLQWELDNPEIIRIRERNGDIVEHLRDMYAQARQEVLQMYYTEKQLNNAIMNAVGAATYKEQIRLQTVKKIVDYYSTLAYTVDKALGDQRYNETRKNLENLANQQILLQEQINAEQSKKHTDNNRIKEIEQEMSEIAVKIANLIDELVEDIIGGTAEDIAQTLGDAFFEAAAAGEDAMKAWGKKAKEIVADIVKRMIVQKFIEPRMGEIFDKWKSRWFPNGDGTGAIDRIIGSIDEFSSDINAAGYEFQTMYNVLSDSLKDYISETDAAREGSERGIATASQDSVDELNGRMTAIQSHTYSINENTKRIASTTDAILKSVVRIDAETNGFGSRLERMESNLKSVKNTMDDIAIKGIKIQ